MTLCVFFGQPSHHQDTSSIHNEYEHWTLYNLGCRKGVLGLTLFVLCLIGVTKGAASAIVRSTIYINDTVCFLRSTQPSSGYIFYSQCISQLYRGLGSIFLGNPTPGKYEHWTLYNLGCRKGVLGLTLFVLCLIGVTKGAASARATERSTLIVI
jgi:hypothetical protein